jgi:hypothetical protein
MAKNKKIIEESFSKMKTLLESKLNEAPAAAPMAAPLAPTQPAQQPAGQQAPAADPQRDQKIAQSIDATMDQAMAKLVQGLPDILGNFAKTAGDKDGAIDAPGVYDNNAEQGAQPKAQPSALPQQGAAKPIQESDMVSEIRFDEAKFMECMGEELNEGGLLGLVASAPVILKYGGKASSWVGKKMNSQWLQKWGGKVSQSGEKLHHKYISVIEKAIKPFMPNATPEQLHKAADGIFMGGVAILFAGGLADPEMLTGVKGTELGEKAMAIFQKAMPAMGFA